MRMFHIVICGLSGSTIFFPRYLINGTIFEKKSYLTKNVCFDSFYNFVWNISHPKKNRARYDDKRKVSVFLVIFQWLLCFLDRLSKNIQISNFIQIFSVVTEMFRADGQRDMTKRIVVYRNFANAPKNVLNSCLEVSITAPLVFVLCVCVCVCVCVRACVDCFICCLSQSLPQITVTWSWTW